MWLLTKKYTATILQRLFMEAVTVYCEGLAVPVHAASWLRWLVASLSVRRPDPEGFLVHKVALGQVFPRVLQLSPVSIIPRMLRTHSFICHLRCIITPVDSMFQ
jgi:hypothetical protein